MSSPRRRALRWAALVCLAGAVACLPAIALAPDSIYPYVLRSVPPAILALLGLAAALARVATWPPRRRPMAALPPAPAMLALTAAPARPVNDRAVRPVRAGERRNALPAFDRVAEKRAVDAIRARKSRNMLPVPTRPAPVAVEPADA